MTLLLATMLLPLGASAADARSVDQACGSTDVGVTTHQGQAGTGHFSVVILVKNTSLALCAVSGYPLVGLLGAAGAPSGAAIDSPNEAQGAPRGSSRGPIRITLRPGQFAAALLGGTDVPPGDATTCPTAAYTVRLAGSDATTRPTGTLERCSGLFVGPFVPGFNGTSPSGEVVGTAPVCRPTTLPQPGPGPPVQVDAWSGPTLAGSVGIVPSDRSVERYRLVLGDAHPLTCS